MPKLKSIARGLKAAGASLLKQEEHFKAAGKSVVCAHCGGSKFEKKTYKLTTAIREGFWADDASALVCKSCARIEWFAGDL